MPTVSTKEMKIITNGNVTTPRGFTAGGLHCGIKRKRRDLGWLFSTTPATTAGVYTLNQFQAAPLIVTKESIAVEQKLQGLIVNSGVANACTGEQGLIDAYKMRKEFANKIGVPEHYVAVASTGVIGTHLPMEKINAGIELVHEKKYNKGENFAKAILTTDTVVKTVAVQIEIDGKIIHIGGVAKGSGMINPNMATMLAFITTDANVDANSLSNGLKEVTNRTFNMITVDGDCSTNDMVLVMANGQAENEELTENHQNWDKFLHALEFVCKTLAKKIARDGEGATKLIEVHVNGAHTDDEAKKICKAIISSNLVKAAIYGADPNWGRIVCAVGYSEQPIDPNKVTVSIGETVVVKEGLPVYFDESLVSQYMKEETVQIFVELNVGKGYGVGWGCDLTYDYVKINASYRT